MPRIISCPECAANLHIGEDFEAGTTMQCPKCAVTFAVPVAAPSPPETPAPFMNEPGNQGQATRVRYVALAWLCSLAVITYVDRACMMQVEDEVREALLFPKVMDLTIWGWDFSVDPFTIAVYSAFGLAYGLFEVPMGWMGDRVGPRRVLFRIVVCWLFFTALTGGVGLIDPASLGFDGSTVSLVAFNFYTLLVVRFLFGAAEAGALPNISRASKNWFPYYLRGATQGTILLFLRWGGAVAPFLMYVLSYPFGWRIGFVLLSAIGIIWAIAFYWYYRDTPAEHPGVNDAELELIGERTAGPGAPAPLSWRTVFRSPSFYLICLMSFCSNAAWVFFITWVARYLEKNLGMQKNSWAYLAAAGAPLFFGGIACILGGFGTDRQVKMFGPRWGRTLQGSAAYALAAGFFVLAIFMPAVALNNPITAAGLSILCLCLASFAKDFGIPVTWSTIIDVGHKYSGTISGFSNMVTQAAFVISPPIVRWLSTERLPDGTVQENYAPALLYSACMCLAASVCWLFINPRHVIVYSPEDQARLREAGELES